MSTTTPARRGRRRAPAPARHRQGRRPAAGPSAKLGAEGYTSVFVDTDSDDWKKPGVNKIKLEPPDGRLGTDLEDSGRAPRVRPARTATMGP